MSTGRTMVSQRPPRLLTDGMLSSAAIVPDKVAIVAEGVEYSYGQLRDAAGRLASALRDRALEKGDRVVIYMDNTWSCVVSIYGVSLAGGVFVLVNPQTKADKLAFVLNDSDAKILLSDGHLASVYSAAAAHAPHVKHIISSGEATGTISDRIVEGFDDVVGRATPLRAPVGVIPIDLAALIYTSGSTGFPKGVMQTHQSMVFASWSLIEYLRLSSTDKILVVLPISFDYGLYQLLMAMNLGATLVMERSFAFPAQVFNRIQQYDVTVFPGVPTIYAMMISSHKKKGLAFPSVGRVTNTAAALPSEHVPYLQEIFPSALIYRMYGLTECKRVCYLEPELVSEKSESVGKAIPGTEVFLLSPAGEPVPPGEPGILHVRGPHVMAGYWKQPELTAQMLKEGGLPGERILCTHDWFKTDAEGFLYFVGRSDDIIKSRGEKVSPVEVENVLYQIPGVREAAVVGVDDGVLGQSIRAFVALDDGVQLDERSIRGACVARLENYMVPKDVVILRELPKTPNGKVDRRLLASMEVS